MLATRQTNLACQHQVLLVEVAALRGQEEERRRRLYLPIAVLLVGAVGTLLIQRRLATAGAAAWQQVGVAGAAGSGQQAQAGSGQWPQQGQAGATGSRPQQ